jgi:hypothetical protein
MNCTVVKVNVLLICLSGCMLRLSGMDLTNRKEQNKEQEKIILTRMPYNHDVSIYDPVRRTEMILFKECPYTLSAGVYYRTHNGLERMPIKLKSTTGAPMVYNHLFRLALAPFVNKKMNAADDNGTHNFSQLVESRCSSLARVVVYNDVNNFQAIKDHNKRFDLYITIPGVMNTIKYNAMDKKIITKQVKGVFEFKVRKTLYEKSGICYHRFFSSKGMVGAEEFGAKAQNKRMNQ